MKKFWKDIQLVYCNAAFQTASEKILSAPFFPDDQQHFSKDHFSFGMSDIIHTIINKKETQSFQLPK